MDHQSSCHNFKKDQGSILSASILAILFHLTQLQIIQKDMNSRYLWQFFLVQLHINSRLMQDSKSFIYLIIQSHIAGHLLSIDSYWTGGWMLAMN